MKKAFNVKTESLISDKRLYKKNVDEVFNLISILTKGFHTVMLVGHNPSLTELVNTLGTVFIKEIPPTGFV